MINGERLQELLDAGYSVNKCSVLIGEHREKVSRYLQKHPEIEIYEAFDEKVTARATELELERLLYVSDNFRVTIDKKKLKDLQQISIVDRSKLRELINQRKIDAIDDWVSRHEPSEISATLINSNRHIAYYVGRVYGNYRKFRETYALDYRMLDEYDRTPGDVARRLGYEFEHIISEILSEIAAGPIVPQATQPDGSRPDFVVNGSAWVDAKLSRSTAFHPYCKTLDKYADQAGTLTIIYAIKDTLQSDSRAEFIYVMALIPLLSPNLQRKVREFVAEAQVQRVG